MWDHFRKTLGWSSYKINLQTMEALIETRWFQKLVRDARNVMGVPKHGYQSKLHGDEPSSYIILSDKEDWEWQPNKDPKRYAGKDGEFYKILDVIFKKTGLPHHFERAIKTYIYYNKLSAPGVDFLVDVNRSPNENLPSLPKTKLFKAFLDVKNRKFLFWLIEICTKRDYSLLQTKRLDPKRELDEKISLLKEVKTIEKNLKKNYLTVKDEDIASALLEKKGIIDDKNYSSNNIKKIVKKIQNARQYIANVYKERGIPQS